MDEGDPDAAPTAASFAARSTASASLRDFAAALVAAAKRFSTALL